MTTNYDTDETTSDSTADHDARPSESSREPNTGTPNHAAPEGAGVHPLIDLSRDPNPGVADHAAPDDEDD